MQSLLTLRPEILTHISQQLQVSLHSLVATIGLLALVIVIVGSILQGLGHGLVRPPISASLANSVDETDLGIAAASERMMFQIGSALGITLLTVIYGGVDEPGTFAQTFLVGAVLAGFGAVALSFLRPGVYRAPDPPNR